MPAKARRVKKRLLTKRKREGKHLSLNGEAKVIYTKYSKD